MKTVGIELQAKAVMQVRDYRNESENLTNTNRERLYRIYREYKTFRDRDVESDVPNRGMRTDFKVNKAHEVVEKVLVRIIGKDPKWIVSPRNVEAFTLKNESAYVNAEEGRAYTEDVKERSQEWSMAVQDYLTYVFDEYNIREKLKICAKNLVVYGKCYAVPTWKYEVARVSVPKVQQEVETEEEVDVETPIGEEVMTEEEKVTSPEYDVQEMVIGQYPSIEPKSWTEVYYDPRYIFLEDRPAMVEVKKGVRLAQLLENKKQYMNLDKVKDLADMSDDKTLDQKQFLRRIYSISGITLATPKIINRDSLTITKYYGYFNTTEDPKNEKLYEICTVEDMILISLKEITMQPMEEAKCFDDPETAFATGFVEPIIGMQQEMNWKKNSASEYINQKLTRRIIWSPMSGVNPKDLMNPIIATTKSGQEALANLPELQLSDIPSSYFNEENDLERQIQAMSFTVDTSNPRNQNALTNTATGARIKFFESNSVIDEVRKVFEKFMERIAYKLLMETFENLDQNIVFKKTGTEEYWNVNKEMLRNAIQRYSIRVESGSSSADSIESRREEALALLNGAMLLKNLGLNPNVQELARDYYETFEKKDPDKYLGSNNPVETMQKLGLGGGQPSPEEMSTRPKPAGISPAQLTDQVAGGDITSLI